MPIIKSAIKRAKQTKTRTARNLVTKRAMRSEVKAVESAVEAGNAKEASEALVRAQSAIDTAVKKNIIHKNRASRKKSQLNSRVKAITGGKKTATKKPAAKKAAPKKTAAKKPAAKKTTAKKTAAKK